MAKLKDVTKSVATRAKVGKKAVTQAGKRASKAVTRARAGAAKLAAKAADTLSPTTARRKRVKRALA